jgi:hypothetical protein
VFGNTRGGITVGTLGRRVSWITGVVLALAGTGTVLAADATPTVEVSGVVLDTEGQPAIVESARVDEFETPESEGIRTEIDVAADGTFSVSLREWGVPEQPAVARFAVFGVPGEPVVINEDGCTETTTPFGTIDVPIPGEVPTEPITIVMDQSVVDGLCPPVTATPEPEAPDPEPDVRAPSVTLPPTDTQAGSGPALAGSVAAALLLAGIALVGAGFVAGRRANRAR